MGLMDKFKNLFTDEEIIEEEEEDAIEIKEVKQEEEHKLPTFMREKIAKEEQKEENLPPKVMKIENDVEIKKEIKFEKNIEQKATVVQQIEEKPTFKFPIDFSENDFVETRSRQAIHGREATREKRFDVSLEQKSQIPREKNLSKKEPKVSELYKDKKKEKVEQTRKFKATPIISPIYGVLDKNYSSSEVEENVGENFEEKRPSKSVDFDSVRKKAYGNLTEEIKENLMCENCEYLKEAKECQREKERQQWRGEFKEEPEYNSNSLPYEDITLDEATENYYDYGVEYEKAVPNEDTGYYDVQGEDDASHEDVKILNHEEESKRLPKKEVPPVKSSINLLSTLKKSMGDESEIDKSTKKDLELTDDLFNLIDSMYDERNDS